MMVRPMRDERDAPATDGIASAAEAYGFVGWVVSTAFYVTFLFWAFLPDDTLRELGITYYPDQYWALAVPSWICVTVVCVFWMYEGCVRQARQGTPPGRVAQR